MKFCVIIPSRGDRPQFTEQCFRQLYRMTLKPDKIYHINHKPINNDFDLVHRVKSGVEFAKKDGFDLCFIIEDDDHYGADYFERFASYFDNYEFFGQNFSYYYHIGNRTWQLLDRDHKHRSSLCATGFKISAINNFEWPPLFGKPFLDVPLWKYARHKKRIFIDTGMIGIKHGIGVTGGIGHKREWPNKDPNLTWLKGKVDKDSFEFYKLLSEQINAK